jgi:pantothenate kinase-related protein Tda10
MTPKTLTINVVGSVGTGKSTIAYLLADFLSHIGFENVSINLLDDINVEQFEDGFEDRLQSLQDTGLNLIINEVQSKRENGND